MNEIILSLKAKKEVKENELKRINCDLYQINQSLNQELYKETRLFDKILKNNLVDIINMIHKRNLKCSAVSCTETIYGNAIYRISDGNYNIDIKAENGTVVTDLTNIDNDGGGTKLYKNVEILLQFDIIPYCENKKIEYIDNE